MERLAQLTWGPWLVWGLPLVGIAVALLTWRRRPRVPAPAATRGSAYRAWQIASCAGLGALGATAASVQIAGPGVVAWMWLGAALGLPIVRAQARLAASPEPPPPPRPLRPLLVAAGLAVAALAVAPLQAQQMGLVFAQLLGLPPWSAAAPLLAIVAATASLPAVRDRLITLAPVAVAMFSIGAVVVLLQRPGAVTGGLRQIFEHALDFRPVAAGIASGGLTVAMVHGVARAVMAGEIGLGTPARGPVPRRAPARAARDATIAAVTSVLAVGTLSALVMLSSGAGESPVAGRVLLPLERATSRGLRPNPDVGQTVVLPQDTAMEAGKRYKMVLRSNPRGNAFFQSRLLKERNMVVVPAFGVLRDVDTVVFRPHNATQARNPAWDVRIRVERRETEHQGFHFYELTPADPDVNFQRVIHRRALDATPFLVASDYHFIGHVSTAVAPDELGEHLAMYERRPQDAPPDPAFHEFFRMGYRGPYPDDGAPRPPWALVADPAVHPPLGAVLNLELRPPPRGSNVLAITSRGDLEAPPWRFLLDAREVVFRHEDGPDHDVYVPVTGAIEEGRLRFRARVPQWENFRVVQKMPHLSGPYLLAPKYRFSAEVRSGVRLPEQFSEHRALIPLHPQGEPTGPADTLPYDPHPGEVLATDMRGPFPAVGPGAAAVAATFADPMGPGFGGTWFLLCALLLAITTLAAWTTAAGPGPWRWPTGALMAAGVLWGAGLDTTTALATADVTIGAAATLGVLAVLTRLGALRAHQRLP